MNQFSYIQQQLLKQRKKKIFWEKEQRNKKANKVKIIPYRDHLFDNENIEEIPQVVTTSLELEKIIHKNEEEQEDDDSEESDEEDVQESNDNLNNNKIDDDSTSYLHEKIQAV